MIAIAAGNATRQRRTGSSSTRAGAETATNPPDGAIRAGDRATVGAMFGSRAPIAETVAVSAQAVEQYQHRVKPGLDLAAARGELERLRALGEISAGEPAWLNAATPAPYYLLIGDAIVLPLLPQGEGWVATTCVTQLTLTPTRRSAKSARKASLAARKRAERRARS